MKVLSIIANPNPQSFGHALMDSFKKGLQDAGHEFDMIDLYQAGFDPVVQMQDVAQFKGAKMPDDVLEQQEKVAGADALTFIGPIYWGQLPAIMVGWFQRVFSLGFAYAPPKPGQMGPQGLLPNKKALVMTTTMAMKPMYEGTGLDATIKGIYAGYILKSCGVDDIDYKFFYGVPLVGDEARKRFLSEAYQLGKDF